MPRPRAPWWMYIVAASYLLYFSLFWSYVLFLGPESLGLEFDQHGVINRVLPDSPVARAGIESGDHLLAVDGETLSYPNIDFEWDAVASKFEAGRPIHLEIERAARRRDVPVTLQRPRQVRWSFVTTSTGPAQLLMLLVGIFIAFKRPSDPIARWGAFLLATGGVYTLGEPYGFWAAWRHLPILLSGLLWIPRSVLGGVGALFLTFFAIFPRRMFRARWAWALIWAPVLLIVPWVLYRELHFVYRPDHVTGLLPGWVLRARYVIHVPYFMVAMAALVFNYRRLEDLNEKRRLRVLVVGTCAGMTPLIPIFLVVALPALESFQRFFFSPQYLIFSSVMFLAVPLSFAYAILRHRVFDLGVIVRRGLQYALARRLLVSAVPVLAGILLLDLLLHGDQPILAVFRARGWMYAALAALAAIAYTQRQRWLEALDRRFFREHYDGQRLLREVVEEVRGAQSFEQQAPRVVARIEAALHPEFAALLVREPREPVYHTLAAAPAGQAPAPLPAESRLMALVRLLGKPLEVPHSESGWLQQQLPHEETEFLRRARIDLVVPVATSPDRTEALLALGVKRSEEPYSGEDQDLLLAIAASLAILLEKPSVPVAPRRDIFEECPKCGTCYDTGITHCAHDSATLVPVRLPRLLEGRYSIDHRLGRGGMGTVYAASDTALERRVAVKVIREDLVGSAEAAERFRREARAAAGFAHPNVVTVHDFGVAAGTRAFLVMELLSGATLREELRGGNRLAPPRTLTILSGVCSAVETAHRRQLLHRDLKPENIFLVRDGSHEIAKVLDFGIAKFLPSATQQATTDTGTGMLVGTFQYMSPEQLRGDPATSVWDLWALAVVAYEMLTGAHPFAGTNAVEWQCAVAAGQFRPLATHLPDAPARWQEFFNRALAAEPRRRPQAAELFFSELQSTLT